MADLSDVETALVTLIAGALYPNGIAALSAIGTPARVYRGWPVPAGLDADLKQGVVNVSVYAGGGMSRKLEPWLIETRITALPVCSLTVSVAGATVTFTGTCVQGQVAAVSFGGQEWAYAVQQGDTPAAVAQALAGPSGGSVAGAALTLPTNQPIIARTMVPATTATDLRRQEQVFRISFWCPDPQSRDAAVAIVDAALAATPFLPLADGTAQQMLYVGTDSSDQSENANYYRRDLRYSVQYPTSLVQAAPRVLLPTLTIAPNGGAVVETLVS